MTDKPPVTYLRVRNWSRFQYRTDKTLPWIRTYDAQLENYEYTSLSDAQRGHLHDIRLLANRTHNKIPNDCGWVRAAIRASRAPDLQRLCSLGFLEAWVPDSELPANERVPDAHRAHKERTESAGDREGEEIETTRAVPVLRPVTLEPDETNSPEFTIDYNNILKDIA